MLTQANVTAKKVLPDLDAISALHSTCEYQISDVDVSCFSHYLQKKMIWSKGVIKYFQTYISL